MKKNKSSNLGAFGPLFSDPEPEPSAPSSVDRPADVPATVSKSREFLKRPLVFLDLEATGLDTAMDRIVEICLIRVTPDGLDENFTSRINPGIPIPPESTAIHGISDADVRNAPFFKAVAPKVEQFLTDADLGGYNIARFDVPMLANELARAGLSLGAERRRIIDAMKIFHKKESRDLAAAYKFYCRKTLESHHSAQADTAAARDIFFGQLDMYPDLPKDVDALHAFCNALDSRFVDGEGKFSWRHGQAHFNFGKHKGHSLQEVARIDRDYLIWLMEGSGSSPELAAICRNALDGEFPRRSS
ncbi:MAG: 3'-5' exonuclease [Elusimicrobia bacterium]|nr:3'-5' exonuclease [Elusimicrobiota bacterium]